MVFGMTAVAGAYSFTLDSYNVTLRNVDPGLVLWWDDVLGVPITFNAEEGDVLTADLFRVGTDEWNVNDDDIVEYDILVDFVFSSPDVDGVLSGQSWGVARFIRDDLGVIEWNNPAVFHFDGTAQFEMSLSDVTFHTPSIGGATVEVTFEYTNAPTPVPEPASMALLCTGLAGLAGIRRKLRKNR